MTETAPSTFAIDCPYPGIRPFTQAERKYFFGRQAQIGEIVERLTAHHFSAVIGGSGCGKSSLVRAGVIPELESMAIPERGDFWRVATMTPGDAPLESLVTALESILDAAASPAQSTERRRAIEANLLENLDLAAFLDEFRDDIALESGLPKEMLRHVNLLLLVDQFEEIFRESNADSSAARQLVRMIVNAERQKAPGIYVVMTMRSEDIHRCAAFLDLPDILNKAAYLTRRLDEEELAEAIIRPAQLACWRAGCLKRRADDGEMDLRPFTLPVLRELLDATASMKSDPDHLPLLQHTLLMLWLSTTKRWQAEGLITGAEGEVEITGEDLADALGMSTGEEALASDHAGRAMSDPLLGQALDHAAKGIHDGLNQDSKAIAEELFRHLAHQDSQGQFKREFTDLATIATVTDRDEAAVQHVVDAFSAPYPFIRRTATGRIDVAHEAFIRNWEKCKEWLADERQMVSGVSSIYREAVERRSKLRPAFSWVPQSLIWTIKGLSKEQVRASADWAKLRAGNTAWMRRYLPELKRKFGVLPGDPGVRDVNRQMNQFRRFSLWGNRWPFFGMILVIVIMSAGFASHITQQNQIDLRDSISKLMLVYVDIKAMNTEYIPKERRRYQLIRIIRQINVIDYLKGEMKKNQEESYLTLAFSSIGLIDLPDIESRLEATYREMDLALNVSVQDFFRNNPWLRTVAAAPANQSVRLVGNDSLPPCAQDGKSDIKGVFEVGGDIAYIVQPTDRPEVSVKDENCDDLSFLTMLQPNEELDDLVEPGFLRIKGEGSLNGGLNQELYERLHPLHWFLACRSVSGKSCGDWRWQAWTGVPIWLSDDDRKSLDRAQNPLFDGHTALPADRASAEAAFDRVDGSTFTDAMHNFLDEFDDSLEREGDKFRRVGMAWFSDEDGSFVATLVRAPWGVSYQNSINVFRLAPEGVELESNPPIFSQRTVGHGIEDLAFGRNELGQDRLFYRLADDNGYLETYWTINDLGEILCNLARSLETDASANDKTWREELDEVCRGGGPA
jgi:hypothetical protein